ncbi:MAG: hypothetical protein Rubg2KO_10760 [Rubricoccaceae bacterium]
MGIPTSASMARRETPLSVTSSFGAVRSFGWRTGRSTGPRMAPSHDRTRRALRFKVPFEAIGQSKVEEASVGGRRKVRLRTLRGNPQSAECL